jgi:peptidoglycan/LPS O-acetylase OafA/YrhL
MGTKSSYIQSLGTLQLLAVVTIVIGHYWIKDNAFINSLCVSFCFVYSGYFTAKLHRFGPEYGLKDHLHFLRDKLVRLYPLHVLAIVLNVIIMMSTGILDRISIKVLLAHLTLLSPWIPNSDYYFGYNPVAWFVCDMFFLYLMAPLVVRLLRRFAAKWQVLLIIALLVLEFVLGYGNYSEKELQGQSIFYYLYEFPPVRLLDFAVGIVLFNVTQTDFWTKIKSRLTTEKSTVIEVADVVLFLILYWVGRTWIHPHCYRVFCASAPAIVALFAAFILTSSHYGQLSKFLCTKPLALLSTVSTEIYLLQFCVYFALLPICSATGIDSNIWLHLPLVIIALIVTSWAVNKWYCTPIRNWLKKRL